MSEERNELFPEQEEMQPEAPLDGQMAITEETTEESVAEEAPVDMIQEHLISMQQEQVNIARDREDNLPQWYGNKKKKITGDVVRLLSIIIVVALIALVIVHYHGINLVYTAELGEGRPNASVFFKNGNAAEYAAGKDVDLKEEGTYVEVIRSNRWLHVVVLKVKDTKAPVAENANRTITTQETLQPADAIINAYDASEYLVSWVDEPQFGSSGVIYTQVRLTDSYENTTDVPVTITIFEPLSTLSWPMGGETRPEASDFLGVDGEGHQCAFVTDLDSITWDVMGEYEITLSVDSYIYKSKLVLTDGEAPVFATEDKIVEKNAALTPEDFITEFSDASDVEFSFVSEPDTSIAGVYNVGIIAKDSVGNESEERAQLTVVDHAFTLEASSRLLTETELLYRLGYQVNWVDPDLAKEEEESLEEETAAEETIAEETVTAEEESEEETEEAAEEAAEEIPADALFVPNELGSRFVTVTSPTGKSLSVYLTIVDTTAPMADLNEVEAYVKVGVEPEAFLSNITDATEVTVSYLAQPDWSKEGETTGIVLLTDAAGNQTSITVKATLLADTEAPEIFAAIDRTCYVGEAVIYLKEVFAIDNADGEVEVSVDKSAVNSREEGEYPVTYTATDTNGNTTTVTVTYTFIEQTVTDEMLDEMVLDIFSEIFVEGMTVVQQARAIYDYVFNQIYYTGQASHTDWKSEAYRGYSEGVGDCYTFYSLTYVLLSNINCEVMSVERIDGIAGHEEHYWCLVNLGSGWYHFDTINVGPDDVQCFMWTQEQCEEHSLHFWKYDTTKYPALETELFDLK